MTLEWVRTLGPILISWPVAALIILLVLRKPLLALLLRFTGDDVKRLKIGGVELERVIEQVEERQDVQESEIRAIQIALKGILTKQEIGLLEGLNGSSRHMIWYEPDLEGYLHRLDGLDFIQPEEGYGLVTIEEQHGDDEKLPVPPHERPKFDLKKYVYITDDGKRYLTILSSILSKVEEPTESLPPM